MFGIGEFFALASAVAWAAAVIMFTRLGDKMPALELNLCKNLIGFTLILASALVFEGFALPDMSAFNWSLLIISGVMGIAIADTLYMKALNTIGAAQTGVVAVLYSPFVVFLSMIYLGETLAMMQWLGMLLVLLGIFIISREKTTKNKHHKHQWLGIFYGATAVFLTASSVVLIKPLLEQQPLFWSTALRLFAGLVGMFIFIIFSRRVTAVKQELARPHNWKAIVISSVLGTYLAMLFWLAGFKYTQANIAAILNETSSIFIVFLAWFVLKESLSWKKILGAALALVGVFLVLVFYQGD
ncbi:DMT family transporter [Pleionea sp. CnH1-48]|uniref:DMT family transporter n=1 Tax=Pleionea sp. CnH1-48 TaxID=2954494 RepID=UPI002097A404|nr:DMT family transporter [Pleionea sp. CnH1-48]MCO7227452.1 DMT family transporter [Pleionea sp. CnH1-48]